MYYIPRKEKFQSKAAEIVCLEGYLIEVTGTSTHMPCDGIAAYGIISFTDLELWEEIRMSMGEVAVRRAKERDIPVISKLLFEVHKVHSDVRPDLFKAGAKKYTDEELKEIIADGKRPVFVAERDGDTLGYAFCVHQQYINHNNMTDIKTLYIDDLCVDESARGTHIGKALYESVLDYAKKTGCYNVTLNVWAGNVDAVKFYEKAGLEIQKIGMEKIL